MAKVSGPEKDLAAASREDALPKEGLGRPSSALPGLAPGSLLLLALARDAL